MPLLTHSGHHRRIALTHMSSDSSIRPTSFFQTLTSARIVPILWQGLDTADERYRSRNATEILTIILRIAPLCRVIPNSWLKL
ncbi:hypothetical protein TNCV_4792321 [Trichonephila clavipes]|nr:hypothetical protein TNCV_4792321 [Trichonephila clavipes]